MLSVFQGLMSNTAHQTHHHVSTQGFMSSLFHSLLHDMFAIIFSSIGVALLSLLLFRRRNGDGVQGRTTRTFDVRALLEKLNAQQWIDDSITASSKQNSPATTPTINAHIQPSPGSHTPSRLPLPYLNRKISVCAPLHNVEVTPPHSTLPLTLLPSSRPPTPFPQLRHPRFSFSAPSSGGQKALPGFSFSDLAIPVASPVSSGPAAAAGERVAPTTPTREDTEFDFGRPALESPWQPGFALRDRNAKKSNTDARATAPWGSLEADSGLQNSIHSRGVSKRERSKGAGISVRRAIARFGQRLAKLDDSHYGRNGDENDALVDVGTGGVKTGASEMNVNTTTIRTPTLPLRSRPRPRSVVHGLQDEALGSHPPSPDLRASPVVGEPNADIDIRPSNSSITSSFSGVYGKREKGLLRRRFCRVGNALGLHTASSPYPPFATCNPPPLLHLQYHQPSSLETPWGTTGTFEPVSEGSKAKTSFWKFGAGRKRASAFEVDRVARSDSVSLQLQASGESARVRRQRGRGMKRMRLD
ncbi:hypothetical protein K458DRAFT_431415 [Lentithecium fluviatile CBS 122367]|uniref:Uncharacterized protein n=1 Tax=Lentithecium fluviatile CBS 122367 TaxID=1168545 RepID=A0A6G1J2P5_9PLEO|nr:hypothetical protein K458DRAFT_431415 [Lentithecium fluviatile CBS 122367]